MKGSPPDCWTARSRLWGTVLPSEEALRRPEALGGAAALRRCDWTRLRHRALHLERGVLASLLLSVDGVSSKELPGPGYCMSPGSNTHYDVIAGSRMQPGAATCQLYGLHVGA
jgi:hypothetical protein